MFQKFSNIGQMVGDSLWEGIAAFLKTLAGKFARDYIAQYNDYQPLVYPPISLTMGNPSGMYVPLWMNVSDQEKIICNWDLWISTSNATGGIFTASPLQDTGQVKYYNRELDIHGHHDLVIWPGETRNSNINNPFTEYTPYLEGLTFYNTITGLTMDDINENTISEKPNRIVFSFPFLVKPNNSPYTEDVTRLSGIQTMYFASNAILMLFTRATSIFDRPEQNFTQPIWYNPVLGVMNVVLNILVFFCATVENYDSKNPICEIGIGGQPTGIFNREIVMSLPSVVTSNTS